METTPVNNLNVSGVFSETQKIIKANNSHFFALSLFFLPLSFSLVITPTLHLSGNFFTDDLFHNFPNVIIFHLLYTLIIFLLSFCAIGTISYSTYNVLLGKPVNYSAAIKSLTSSFFPIVSTAIAAHTLLLFISLTFLLFLGVLTVIWGQILGFAIDYNSNYFIWFSVVVGVMLILMIIYFQMNWCLAFMVVVSESKWGFEALKRSSYLVKGMRSVSLSLLLNYSIGNGALAWEFSNILQYRPMGGRSFVFFTMLGSFFLMMCFLGSIVAHTVLYMHCKALHGELADHEYSNLPSDDEKVHGSITVVVA